MRPIHSLLFASTFFTATASATDYRVAPSGGDFSTIQAALDVAVAGDRVLVEDKPGGYVEKLAFPRSGNAVDGFIELSAAPGHAPALDGTGVPGPWMVTLVDCSYIRIVGLEIRNNLDVTNDGSGIRIQGAGSHVELRDNVIHDMRGFGAMAITVYGTSTVESITGLVIDGNLVYDCEPADSEAITLNGNVERFEVTNNVVRDVNNIGIDFIGGEAGINPTFVARDGLCRGNVVVRANANYGGGYAAGIYVDGGRDIRIEGNVVVGCDLGIEVGAENAGITTTGVTVVHNLVYRNEKVGIVFGGYAESTGRVEDCAFVHNVVYMNDSLQDGNGELWIQFANANRVSGNVFVCGPQNLLLANYSPTSGNQLDHNLWFSAAGSPPEFVWNGAASLGLSAFRAATGQGAGSLFADPLLASPLGPDGVPDSLDEDFSLLPGSPGIDAGDNGAVPAGVTTDFGGASRFVDDPLVPDSGTGTAPIVDMGALEHVETLGTAYCFGDGSGSPCPCGNDGAAGEGCRTTTGGGITLILSGTTSLAADDLVLTAEGVPPNNTGIFYAGQTLLAGNPLFDGLQCVGGSTLRFRGQLATTSTVSDTGLVAQDVFGAFWTPGTTYGFQYFTRDNQAGPSPCAGFANLSHGVSVVMAP